MRGIAMIELPIGTRFYYNDVPCEVSPDRECIQCPNCAFDTDDHDLCKLFACEQEERKDKTEVFFEIVEKSADGGRANGHRADD